MVVMLRVMVRALAMVLPMVVMMVMAVVWMKRRPTTMPTLPMIDGPSCHWEGTLIYIHSLLFQATNNT